LTSGYHHRVTAARFVATMRGAAKAKRIEQMTDKDFDKLLAALDRLFENPPARLQKIIARQPRRR
jgi:hypothetical protein